MRRTHTEEAILCGDRELAAHFVLYTYIGICAHVYDRYRPYMTCISLCAHVCHRYRLYVIYIGILEQVYLLSKKVGSGRQGESD